MYISSSQDGEYNLSVSNVSVTSGSATYDCSTGSYSGTVWFKVKAKAEGRTDSELSNGVSITFQYNPVDAG